MDDAMDDAMVVLQDSVNTIVNTTKRLSAFEATTKDVVTAMDNITNKITSLEAKLEGLTKKDKEPKMKASLLTKVTT